MAEVSTITKVNFFRGYGIYTAGAYAKRLASCVANIPFVFEDVVNREGTLLIAKGRIFESSDLNAIDSQHLRKPLDTLISLSNVLSSFEVELDITRLLDANAFLAALSERKQSIQIISTHLNNLSSHPLLQQKLTVMKVTQLSYYERTLMTLVFALLVAQEMRLTREDQESIIWAALYHDIGLLHLDEAILQEDASLSVGDLLQLHAHVRVAQAIMALEGVVSSSVIDAVLDHQERCDGTGYPNGKLESEMSFLGQILGFSDSAVAIFYKRMLPQGRGWRDVAAAMAMSRQSFMFRGGEVFQSLLRQSELPLANVISGSDAFGFSHQVLSECAYLQRWFEVLRYHLMGAGFVHGDRHLHALQNSVLHIAIAYKSVLEFNTAESLTLPVQSDSGVIQSVDELHLAQQELAYHVRRLTRMLMGYVSENRISDPLIQNLLDRCVLGIKPFIE